MLKTISRTTPAKLIENSSESFFERRGSPTTATFRNSNYCYRIGDRLPSFSYFYFPSRASLRIFSILVVIKSIATVLVTPSGMITSA